MRVLLDAVVAGVTAGHHDPRKLIGTANTQSGDAAAGNPARHSERQRRRYTAECALAFDTTTLELLSNIATRAGSVAVPGHVMQPRVGGQVALNIDDVTGAQVIMA